MNRLARYLQKANSTSKGIPEEFWTRLHTLRLTAGEFIPFDTPPDSWIFVEEGCLASMFYQGKWWCSDILAEGSSLRLPYEGEAEIVEGRKGIRAVEDSIVYYLEHEESINLHSVYPDFIAARCKLAEHFLRKYFIRRELLFCNILDRIRMVEMRLPYMFRLPMDVLAEYLQIQSEPLKNALAEARERYYLQHRG